MFGSNFYRFCADRLNRLKYRFVNFFTILRVWSWKPFRLPWSGTGEGDVTGRGDGRGYNKESIFKD